MKISRKLRWQLNFRGRAIISISGPSSLHNWNCFFFCSIIHHVSIIPNVLSVIFTWFYYVCPTFCCFCSCQNCQVNSGEFQMDIRPVLEIWHPNNVFFFPTAESNQMLILVPNSLNSLQWHRSGHQHQQQWCTITRWQKRF